tara:strand:+ start:1340 stop:2305 length:966 start_codon:yes stop_codon:yes gene_type:complete
MRILIVSPGGTIKPDAIRTGNRSTASQWGDRLSELGHDVRIAGDYDHGATDLLIALHGDRSFSAMADYRAHQPAGKLVLGLAGTDIYPKPGENTLAAMALADAIIALQPKAIEQIPAPLRSMATVIVQSATPSTVPSLQSSDFFDVCVIGHLRKVKDPMLTATAARLLPQDSKIRVLQAGGILDQQYESLVSREEQENPRYHWLDELPPEKTSQLIASSQLLCLTSLSEGGARVIGEAIVEKTPVISTRIDGSIGLLGENYPGYFPVGDAKALAELLWQCESDLDFFEQLTLSARSLAPEFSCELERAAFADLIAELFETR